MSPAHVSCTRLLLSSSSRAIRYLHAKGGIQNIRAPNPVSGLRRRDGAGGFAAGGGSGLRDRFRSNPNVVDARDVLNAPRR